MGKLTRKQIIGRFLTHINGVAEYAEKESRWSTPREKIRGAIFSTLAAIDGSAAVLPAFNLCPAPHPDDLDYCKERGEDYYPAESEHLNIAGELHSAFCQFEEKPAAKAKKNRLVWTPNVRGKETVSWELRLDGMRITVHRLMGCPGEWYCSCPQLDVDDWHIANDGDLGMSADSLQKLALDGIQKILDTHRHTLAKYRGEAGQ